MFIVKVRVTVLAFVSSALRHPFYRFGLTQTPLEVPPAVPHQLQVPVAG